jgi:hypothetical protein
VADRKKGGGMPLVVKLMIFGVGVVLMLLAGVLAWGLTLPVDYRFERSIVIDGDSDDVHAWVGDLRKWDEWGPWRDEDPDMKYTYGESTTKAGDKMSWTGKDGSGSLTFTSVDAERGVEYSFQWEDYDPTPGAVTYEEVDDGKVRVTWSMESKDTPFLTRYFMTFGEGTMNEMFDKGLAKLKTKVEG